MKRSCIVGGFLAALLIAATGQLFAQEPKPLPTFEVASVKPNTSAAMGPMMLAPKGDRFVATNVPLVSLLSMAYQLRPYQLVDLPQWLMTERFDIQAKTASGVPLVDPQATQQPFMGAMGTPQPFMLMLRGLLTERFGLKARTETRELPIYTLVRARVDGKLGPKLKPSTVDCAAIMRQARESSAPPPMPSGPPKPGDPPSCFVYGGFGRLANASTSMAVLAMVLEGSTGRSVQDRTGLEGTFEVELTWTPEQVLQMVEAGRPLPQIAGMTIDPNGPSLFTAIQEQLGLKLEPGKGPVEVFIIDSISRPTPD